MDELKYSEHTVERVIFDALESLGVYLNENAIEKAMELVTIIEGDPHNRFNPSISEDQCSHHAEAEINVGEWHCPDCGRTEYVLADPPDSD